jgi:hypothetical protein
MQCQHEHSILQSIEHAQVLATAVLENERPPHSSMVYACAARTLARCMPHLVANAPWVYENVLSLFLRAYQAPTRDLGKLFLFHGTSGTEPSDGVKGVV